MVLSTLRNAATLLAAFCLAAAAQPAKQPPASNIPAPTAQPAPAIAVYASLGERPAIVYDAPSLKANKTFIFGRHHVVEVLVKLDMLKVHDADGTVGWVEASALGMQRYVQVTAPVADVRATPTADAALAFEAAKGVEMETTGPAADGWVPVRHKDGLTGFVRTAQVFGD